MRSDLIIVGAGPAGLALAHSLIGVGLQILIIDMRPVLPKTCPLLAAVSSIFAIWHNESLPRWRERSILDTTA